MRAKLFILLILYPFLTSFFWNGEERELRHTLQMAECALQKGDLETAKNTLEELWEKYCVTSKHHVDWNIQTDIALKLAQTFEKLEDFPAAEKILGQILDKSPPPLCAAPLMLLRGRLIAPQSPQEAYSHLIHLASFHPISFWPQQDIIFFHALEETLNQYYDEQIHKGKCVLMAHLYADALIIYEHVLQAIMKGYYPKVATSNSLIYKNIKYRVAECHYLLANYEKSLAICQGDTSEGGVDCEILYLTALCFNKKHEYAKALNYFENYLYNATSSEREYYDYALFEIGYHYYQQGAFDKAKSYFVKLLAFHRKPTWCGVMLLARIYLNENCYEKARNLLTTFSGDIVSENPLYYESIYLQGIAAYGLGDYEKAIQLLEGSLLKKKCSWRESACHHMALAYLYLIPKEAERESYLKNGSTDGKADTLPVQDKKRVFYQRACHLLEGDLSGTKDFDEGYVLSLAQLYSLGLQYLGLNDNRGKIEGLLRTHHKRFSKEGEHESLLIQAQVATDFETKIVLYNQATESQFAPCRLYAEAWYLKGIAYFQEGIKQRDPSSLFHLATTVLEEAFSLSTMYPDTFQQEILKAEAKSHCYTGHFLTSLHLIEKIITLFPEHASSEETLYLKGLIASFLNDSHYNTIAEQALIEAMTSFPQGKFYHETLYTLASLYHRRQHYQHAYSLFLRLTESPLSPLADAAWFWAAEAALMLKEPSFKLREHVYTDFPQSPLVPLALLKQYPLQQYLEGEEQALAHLKNSLPLFKKNPLSILAYYLLGHTERDPLAARSLFEHVLSAFYDYYKQCDAPEESYVFIYYKTKLELATQFLEVQDDPEASEQLFLSVIVDFLQKQHPLSSLMTTSLSYSPLFEEAEFKLAQCYIRQKKESAAQKLFTRMLQHYQEGGIEEGLYYSQVWQQQGQYALRLGNYETAFHSFEVALRGGEGCITDEGRLQLWLLQSECYKGKKEYSTAIRFLSKVINAEIASPLRLKAMYLRAEIYELEGRPELAIRQLEAITKKGGEWEELANEKLRKTYGL